jgi:hypothetical protein
MTFLKLAYWVLIFNPRFVEIHGERLVDRKDCREGKKGRGLERVLSPFVSFFDDRFHRAYLKAASAFGTFLFIDHIGFSFFHGFRRAFF